MHKCTPSSSVFCLLKSIIDCYVLQNLVMRDTINANSVVVYIPTKSFLKNALILRLQWGNFKWKIGKLNFSNWFVLRMMIITAIYVRNYIIHFIIYIWFFLFGIRKTITNNMINSFKTIANLLKMLSQTKLFWYILHSELN